MSFTIDGTNGLTFNDATTQSSTATNASNISSGTLGKARLPTGSVLQVVSATLGSSVATSSTSFVASTLIATITPSSASNKILVLVNGGSKDSNSAGNNIQTHLYRNINGAGYSALTIMEDFYYPASQRSGGHSFNYLDSPATTSSVAYQPYFKVAAGAGSVYFSSAGGLISLTLMEIAA